MGDRINVREHCNFPLENAKQLTCEQLARECLDQVKRGVRDFTLTRPDGTVDVMNGLDECLSAAKSIASESSPAASLDENDVQFYFRIGEGVKFTNASWQSGPTYHYFGDFTELSLHYAPLPMMGLRAVFGRSWLDANDDGAGMHAFHMGLGIDMGSDIRKPFSIRVVGELGMNWFESKDSRFYPDKARPFDFKRGVRSYAGLELGVLNGALSLNSGYEHVSLDSPREGANYLTPYGAESWMFGLAFDLAAAGIVSWGEKKGEKAMDNLVK